MTAMSRTAWFPSYAVRDIAVISLILALFIISATGGVFTGPLRDVECSEHSLTVAARLLIQWLLNDEQGPNFICFFIILPHIICFFFA